MRRGYFSPTHIGFVLFIAGFISITWNVVLATILFIVSVGVVIFVRGDSTKFVRGLVIMMDILGIMATIFHLVR
jgi:hypothetical protein